MDPMDNLTTDTDTDEFIQLVQTRYSLILCEYWDIAMKPSLTEQEQQRLEEIHTASQDDELLSFLIDEVDHLIGHQLDLISADFVHDQQRKLQQSLQDKSPQVLDKAWIDQQIYQRLSGGYTPVSLDTVQRALRHVGVYQGAIDGEYGPKTQGAFEALRRKLSRDSALVESCAVEDVSEQDLQQAVDAQRELTACEQQMLVFVEQEFTATC